MEAAQIRTGIEVCGPRPYRGYAASLERKTGFEPAAPTLARWCTAELLPHAPGAESRNRPATRGFSILLYRLSYLGK